MQLEAAVGMEIITSAAPDDGITEEAGQPEAKLRMPCITGGAKDTGAYFYTASLASFEGNGAAREMPSLLTDRPTPEPTNTLPENQFVPTRVPPTLIWMSGSLGRD